jgi:aspartate/glutamate racemase
MMREKIVGILGGMGSYATLDFFKKILLSTPAKKDWEHLRILIDNNVKILSRTRAVLLMNRYKEYVGVDISKEFIKKVREKYSEL